MMKREMIMNDSLSIDDKVAPLKGVIEISRRNKMTGETEFLHRGENVITISGYQYILEKIFDLYMDSPHNNGYERLDKDTNLVIPDLNQGEAGTAIGQPVASYDPMTTNIAERHFIQGFMVGEGGSSEDMITAKNTKYSFVKLRNPVPFQMSQGRLTGAKSGKYVGVCQTGGSMHSYYIKKFDETPHIYHSWWADGQSWNTLDRVEPNYLGPTSTSPKSSRIETYAECILSIDDTDFKEYFDHDGRTQTATISELGLVAFDIKSGDRNDLEVLYSTSVNPLISMIFDKNPVSSELPVSETLESIASSIKNMAGVIYDTLTEKDRSLGLTSNSNIVTFMATLNELRNASISTSSVDAFVTSLTSYRNQLSDSNNIGVQALYDQNGEIQYTTDKFMYYINSVLDTATVLTEDEAERIRLITYYTFNPIPIERNWELLINYRIYAN